MTIWFAALLGFIQGITEFLPVSSSGHLSVLQNLFGLSEFGEGHLLFDTLLHLATLASVFVVYRRDIVDMVKEVFGFFRDIRHPKPKEGDINPNRRLVLLLIIATLPLILALPFADAVATLYNNTLFIGFAFLATGLILFLSDRLKVGKKTAKSMSVTNALVVGCCQAIAILPGVSRSGSTITAGMANGLDRSFAVKFSFLLSIPAILGANILNLFKASGDGFGNIPFTTYLVGMAVAAVTGYFSIKLVKTLSDKGKFGKFCYYCFAVGIITIILNFVI